MDTSWLTLYLVSYKYDFSPPPPTPVCLSCLDVLHAALKQVLFICQHAYVLLSFQTPAEE